MRKLFVYMMSVSLLSSSCKGQPLPLVQHHSSAYSIVLPQAATKSEQAAATLLQKMLKQATQSDLPVVKEQNYKGAKAIYIGQVKALHSSNYDRVEQDGFLIETTGNDLFITGKRGHATEYAVYRFAETYMGYRKYDSRPVVSPAINDLVIPAGIHLVSNPSFVYRQSYYPMSNDAEYLNWHGLHRFEDLWGLWGHSFFKLLPPATYLAAHPEYYALVNGKRKATQLCLSNKEVLQIVTGKLKQMMADNPDATYWSVSPNDGGGNCTCPDCRKADEEDGSPSGSLIRFVNKVAAVFPDKKITTLGYGYTAKAPSVTKPAKNVIVLLSTIDAYREKPLASIASASGFRNDLTGWTKAGTQLFVWDYATQFTNYLSPFPALYNIQPDFSYFKEQHIAGVFEQGSGDTYSDMAELNSYIQAKLLWDTQADVPALIRDFCEGYYGKAAPYIQQYLDARYKNLQASGRHLDIYGNPVMDLRGFLAPEKTDEYDQLLEKAEQAAGAAEKENVRRVRLSLDYAVLQQSRHFGPEQHGFLQKDNNAPHYGIKPEWKTKVSNFVAAAKKAGVTELSEGGLNPDQYQQEWNGIFSREWPVNSICNAAVTLQFPFAEDYPAKGNHTLTDGMIGFNDFSYNWLCFYGSDMVATADAGQAVAFSKISLHFLDDPRHWIFPPQSIKVEVSDDGVQYKTIGTQTIPVPAEHEDIIIRSYTFPYKGKARFVKVTALNNKTLPEWRNYAAKKPMIACDEIMVLP